MLGDGPENPPALEGTAAVPHRPETGAETQPLGLEDHRGLAPVATAGRGPCQDLLNLAHLPRPLPPAGGGGR
eukprot:4411935-Lingulodinium_polyedra.AAC.1